MSIASSSEFERRRELWARMRLDLAAHGVPHEAWPQRMPRIYHSYTVRRPGPRQPDIGGIQICLGRQCYYVLRPIGENHGAMVPWNGDAAGAWAWAKRMAGWP